MRWQKDEVLVSGSGGALPGGTVCMLDVPVNKTSTALTKPVDPIVGQNDFGLGEGEAEGRKAAGSEDRRDGRFSVPVPSHGYRQDLI